MRRRAVVIGLGALVCSLAGLTWLAVSAPTAVESLAVDLYQRSQAQTAAQAAERIASRLRAVERRLTDPLIRQASGIVNGHDEPSYGAALGAMARPSDPDQGVVLLPAQRLALEGVDQGGDLQGVNLGPLGVGLGPADGERGGEPERGEGQTGESHGSLAPSLSARSARLRS